LEVAHPFAPDITAIKGDKWGDNGAITGKGNNPKKTTSQGTKSAISKAFDTIKIIKRSFPPAFFPLAPHQRATGAKARAGSGE
jgi:hypothetical protein